VRYLRQILTNIGNRNPVEIQNMKFQENPSGGSGQTDGHDEAVFKSLLAW